MKSLEIRLNLYSENHIDIATSYNNLGILCQNMKNYIKSKEFHKKSFEIRLYYYGENNEDTAVSYDNLGYIYEKYKNFVKSEKNYLKSLEIRKIMEKTMDLQLHPTTI